MANGSDVMHYFFPDGGYYIQGDDFSSVFYEEGVTPITKKQFDDTLKTIDSIKARQNEEKAAAKTALLERLGITAEEAKLLLG